MLDNLIALALGVMAGSGWMLAAILVLAMRARNARVRFVLKANHDLYLALAAERAMRLELQHAIAVGRGELVSCAIGCAAAIGDLGAKPKPGVN